MVAFSAPAFAADQTDQQLPTTQGQQPSTDGGADKLNDQNSTPKDQGSNVPDDQGPADKGIPPKDETTDKGPSTNGGPLDEEKLPAD